MLDTAHPTLVRHIKPVAPEHLIGDKIQPGHALFGVVWINPQRVSGAPCFYGTRVPIKTLFDCMAANQTLEQFLDDFEGVDREQALAVLELAGKDLLSDLESLGKCFSTTTHPNACGDICQDMRSRRPVKWAGRRWQTADCCGPPIAPASKR
jgi:uncharacterized protein (DUF433 family)